MGVILADFHNLGRRPCLNDKLKSILRGTADVSAVSLSKRASILSTPQDLLALRQLSHIGMCRPKGYDFGAVLV